jgi:hypothetical protein
VRYAQLWYAVLVGCVLATEAFGSPKPPVSKLTTLLQFHGSDAWTMLGALAPYQGGVVGVGEGSGTVQFMQPPATQGGAWTETTLYRFTGQGGDGAYPRGVISVDGQIFGVTDGGGSTACPNGCGTVFQLTPPATPGGTWTQTQLLVFKADDNGYFPAGALAHAGAKILFGTTANAANDTVHPNGATTPVGGTVFRLTAPASGNGPWTQTVLHHFDAASLDGDTPYGGLTLARNGVIYGTTFTGGRCNQGTVFSLTPPSRGGSGPWTETLLHEFGYTGAPGCDYGDGELPVAGVTLAGGVLYGTTRTGSSAGCGTAFAITLSNPVAYSKIYQFGQTAADGCSPQTRVRVSGTGVVTGTTTYGGGAPASTECGFGCGTIFRLTPPAGGTGAYTEQILYAFQGGLDGSEPSTNLVSLPGGLYGATAHGGFATDTANPDYVSYGTFFKVK